MNWKTFFFLLLIVLSAAEEARSELYHVKLGGTRTSGASTVNDWSSANCYADPASAVAQGNLAVGPHTLYIAPGTYPSCLVLTNNNWASAVISGTAAVGATTPASKGQVVLTNAQSVIQTSVGNVTIKNISATGTTAKTGAFYCSGGSATLENCYFYDSVRLLFMSAGTVTSTRGLYTGNTDSTRPGITVSGTASFTSNFDICGPKGNNSLGLFGLHVNTSGRVSINNSIISGADSIVLYQDTAATTTVTNSIILGGWKENSYTIYLLAGTLAARNNLIMRNWGSQNRLAYGVAIDQTNITTSQPGWMRRPRQGIIVLCVDDIPVDDYRLAMEQLLSDKGVRGSFFVNTMSGDETLSLLQGMNGRGVLDIGLHGRTHSNWTASGVIWNVSKGGATLTINRSADTITFSSGESVTGFRRKTLAAFKTEMERFGATVAPTAIYGDSAQVHTTLTGESLADAVAVTAVALKTDDLTGNSGFFKDEIKDQYDWFVNSVGLVPSVAAVPGGITDANVQTAVRSIGMESLRGIYSAPDAQWELKSIDLYRTSYYGLDTVITNHGTADEATTKARTRAMADQAVQSGSIQFWLTHNASEATIQQLGWIIDVLKNEYPQLMVTDGRSAVSYIKNSGLWTTADGRTYTRTWGDPGDFHLLPWSSAIGTGNNLAWQGIPGVTDYEGKRITDDNGNIVSRTIGGVPVTTIDIGPYQYSTDPVNFTLTLTKSGSGVGNMILSNPSIACNTVCTVQYPTVTTVTLHAEPGADAIFEGWSGACTGTSDCTVAMNANKTVSASFAEYVHIDGTIDVIGGIRIESPADPKPACTVATRGTFWFTNPPATTTDTLWLCGRDGAGKYSWKTIIHW